MKARYLLVRSMLLVLTGVFVLLPNQNSKATSTSNINSGMLGSSTISSNLVPNSIPTPIPSPTPGCSGPDPYVITRLETLEDGRTRSYSESFDGHMRTKMTMTWGSGTETNQGSGGAAAAAGSAPPR